MVVKLVVNSIYKNIKPIQINSLQAKKEPTKEVSWAEENLSCDRVTFAINDFAVNESQIN